MGETYSVLITDKKSLDTAVENNLGLVRLCANRFRGRGIEYDDLYSAGCMGLVKAAKGFDSERGVCFSTYAVPVILGEIKRLFREGGTIKVSRGLKELSLRISRASERFSAEQGREATIGELAEICGCDYDEAVEAYAVSKPPLYISDGGENGCELEIPVEAPDIGIGELVSLRQIFANLEGNDRKLLYFRYFKSMTQSAVAKKLGMTQVQVSRREKKLLETMKKELLK